jgi:predicted Zn-dependent protease
MMTRQPPDSAAVQAALDRGDHDAVLTMTDSLLADRPGDDAAHELRARALLALGRADEAERHASDAVRLDPDEIRYRELLAQVLATRGAHRDAAAEYHQLAQNDPRQPAWILAEAQERLGGAQLDQAVEAARAAVRLEPGNAVGQLALARALVRSGDATGAMAAAGAASTLLPGDPAARELLADARWLAGDRAAAFSEFRALSTGLTGDGRSRVIGKARVLYRQQAGWFGRALCAVPPLFALALARDWIRAG